MRKLLSFFTLLTHKERRGVLALSAILLLASICTSLYHHREDKDATKAIGVQQQDSIMKQMAFMKSVKKRDERPPYYAKKKYEPTRLPNTKKEKDSTRHTPKLYLPATQYDTLKRAQGNKIELNNADTTLLKQIPGIGSFISRCIVNYRKQLGGFYHIKQLKEIEINDTLLTPWFTIDNSLILPLQVNRATINQLRRHPYINFHQARVIVEHRRKHGNIKNMKDLSLYEEFTERDWVRLAPYLSFE
ncbi:MAG: helix-hairpin-helix domain-containing protein [Mediterranea massiliensis]|nr:helix-hairpin-helix domain-containing protein [Mediterranea massiliensis]